MYEESKENNQVYRCCRIIWTKIIFHPREISLNTEISINKRFLAKAKNETKNYIITVEHYRIESGDDTEFFYGAWNKPRTNELVGPILSDVNEHYDLGLIDLSNMSKSLKALPSIRNTDSEQFPQLYINDGMPVLIHGVHLCKSGYTTHVACGFVKAFDTIYHAGDEEFDSDLIMTSMDGLGGDMILNGTSVYNIIGNVNTMILPLSMIISIVM
ncbi:hypothetical protein F8M41_006394 [Gigaspora margarita]|uniref:Uncharacterized protein n=1 Tax=Gigaspora margarita TaxID=4874 RepID=A0A8H4A5A9_GIGMA|nr:hypothetical protein F8M41_006394 [Gigaspora margarita]